MPGHTDGSIAIHLPAHRLLFTGDAAARAPDGRVILGPFNVDRAEAISSFRKLAGFDVDVACFGHGDPVLADGSAALREATERDFRHRSVLGRRLTMRLPVFTSLRGHQAGLAARGCGRGAWVWAMLVRSTVQAGVDSSARDGHRWDGGNLCVYSVTLGIPAA